MLEKMVDKFDKRVEKLSHRTSATGLQSTRLAYEIIRDHYNRILQPRQPGELLTTHDGFAPSEILDAMDIQDFNIEFFAYHCVQVCPEYIDFAEKWGISSDTCSSTRCEIGLVLAANLPRPDFVAFETGTCENQLKTNTFLADHYKCPTYVLNTPYYLTPDAIRFYAEELKGFVSFLENLTGKQLDWDRVAEINRRLRAAYASMRRLNELREAVPCPIRGRDALRNIGIVLYAGHDLRTIEYFEGVCRETEERVRKGVGVVPQEKHRLLWCHTAPLFTDVFSFLEEEYGAVVVFDELSYIPPPVDESLGLLEEIAAEKIQFSWNGPAERRVRNVVDIARRYKVDACIHFDQWGCQVANGSAKMVRDTLDKELGIPTLILEGDYMDFRVNSEEQIKSMLASFLDIL